MEQRGFAILLSALACLSQSEARLDAPSQKVKSASLITPPLKDVASDKKFFGPPFPADYPDDKRPVVDKGILNKLKGPDQPYPALQSKADFDRDYVKDENSDKGAWRAQFEYDALRKKLAKETDDERSAADRAAKEGRDVDDAQRKVDEASKSADAAKKEADGAKAGEDGAKGGDDSSAPPSTDSLEQMKKKVAEAEANYEKEKKEFEECKKNLEEAKANLEDVKAQMAALEKKLEGEAKLWAETKTVRLNLKKAKQEAASAKRTAAEARLKVAQSNKADLDRALAKEKAESDAAQKKLQKEKTDMAQAKKDLETAALHLQELRGYKPVQKPSVKSRAYSKALSLSALLAIQAFVR